MNGGKNMENSLNKLILQRKGGLTSLKVMEVILKYPSNINEIADIIKMDYNTVKYHVEILVENNLIKPNGSTYGCVYESSEDLMENIDIYESVKKCLYEKQNLRGQNK